MNTDYTRRSILAGGLSLAGATLTSCNETKAAGSKTKTADSKVTSDVSFAKDYRF